MDRCFSFGVFLGDAEGSCFFRVFAFACWVLRDILIYSTCCVLLGSEANVRFKNGVVTNHAGSFCSSFGHYVVEFYAGRHERREIICISSTIKVYFGRLFKGRLRVTYRCGRVSIVFFRRLRFYFFLFLFILFDGERRVRQCARAFYRVLGIKVIACGRQGFRVPFSNHMTYRRVRRTVKRFKGGCNRFKFCVQRVGARFRFVFLNVRNFGVVFCFVFEGGRVLCFPFCARRGCVFCVIRVLIWMSGVAFIGYGGIYSFYRGT